MEIAVALILLLQRQETQMIPMESLLFDIVSLSYIGDIRMTLGFENENKAKNILKGSLPQLFSLYLPILARNPLFKSIVQIRETQSGVDLALDINEKATEKLIASMPTGIIQGSKLELSPRF